jgi:MoaD family protein
MLRVKVKYLNVYYSITRKKQEDIEFNATLTLGELLDRVCRSYKSKFRDLILDEDSKLKPHAWILINQEREKDLQRKLKDGDVVVFSLPIVGG